MLGHIEYMRKRMKEEQANMQSDNIEMSNMVDHPPPYNTASIETIDMIASAILSIFSSIRSNRCLSLVFISYLPLLHFSIGNKTNIELYI